MKLFLKMALTLQVMLTKIVVVSMIPITLMMILIMLTVATPAVLCAKYPCVATVRTIMMVIRE